MSTWDEEGEPIYLSKHQRAVVDKAIKKAKEFVPGSEDEGRCIEVICVDFIESFEE